MRIRRRSVLEGLICLALLALPARAVITGGGSLVYLVDHVEVVVKARVVAHGEYGAENVSFVIEPLLVLKGSGTAIPQRISVDVPPLVWPEGLDHPYREGAVALFFLEERGGRLNVTNNVHAILPAVAAAGGPAAETASGAGLSRKIYEELARFVPAAASDGARARLLVLLAQVATKGDEDLFTPYLRSDSPLERRGALAALLRLDPTAERVEQARRDLEAFYSVPQDPSREWMFWDLYQEVLDRRHAQERGTDAGLLPLYRALADTLALLPEDRQVLSADRAALAGLVRAGRREDARRLYRYAGSRDAYLRHEALGVLGRMFGLPGERPQVTSYLMPLDPAVVEWERQTQEAVRQALERAP